MNDGTTNGTTNGTTGGATAAAITLVEDHMLFAEALSIALSSAGYEVKRIPLPTNARSVGTLLPDILRTQPTVVLLDLDLGVVGNGVRLIEPLVRAGIKVLVVTGNSDRVQWGECLSHGASLVAPKSMPLDQILAVVRRLVSGLPVIDRGDRAELLRLWHEHRAHVHVLRQRLEMLTQREQEVLGHLMSGHQVRDIAAVSVVSEATVRTQVKSILAKLEVSSQLAAVGVAHQADWQAPQHQGSRMTELGFAHNSRPSPS